MTPDSGSKVFARDVTEKDNGGMYFGPVFSVRVPAYIFAHGKGQKTVTWRRPDIPIYD